MDTMEAPDFFRHAREEVIRALSAPNESGESRHRKRAGGYITMALQEMAQEPDRERDWSHLSPSQQQG